MDGMTPNPDPVAVLRECPFCGGNAIMDGAPGSWGYYPATAFVRCSRCSTRGPTFHDDEGGKRNYRAEAAEAWNRRAAPPGSDAVTARWNFMDTHVTKCQKRSREGWWLIETDHHWTEQPTLAEAIDHLAALAARTGKGEANV